MTVLALRAEMGIMSAHAGATFETGTEGIPMRISDVVVNAVKTDDTKPKSWLSESLVANPMSIYPEYKAKRSSWGAQWGPELLVRVMTDDGIEGIGGPVPAGGRAIIEGHLRNLLLGKDPFDIEKLWDQMFRSSLPYGRKGLPIMAISAIDIALWDIVGKGIVAGVFDWQRRGLLPPAWLHRVQAGDAARAGRWLGGDEG
jgi:hypothetical protein